LNNTAVMKWSDVSCGNLTQPITLRNVTYTYHDKEGDAHAALHDVSLTIESGQKVALVGPSGAGKSTIAHLLLRFIEAQSGTILVGERPLSTIPTQAWRKQIAWVPQRPYLFNASIADNIRLGRADATMAEVVEAARQAHVHDFITSLPYGYDTMIGERGARLGGGQAQRLAIARALLRDAPLLILDEVTAHLDAASEEAVLEALHTLMQGRMALIIAHHLDTARTADRIVVLDAGRVVAYGTHDALLAESGIYCQLISAYERGKAV
jgi:ABC-type multidrug transport system fused ATPase/permease subunit